MVKPTLLSLFTGAGGLDLGFESAGFQIVGAIEKDETARDTLVLNRPNWPVLDIDDVVEYAPHASPSDFGLSRGELDVLAGGPPCQPFSMAAQWRDRGRLGLYDRRAECLDAMLDVIAELQPRVVVVENVPGFVSRPRSGLARLRGGLDQIRRRTGVGYELRHAVLSADAYGVPQLRRRAFVIATRAGIGVEWPEPTHLERPIRSGDALAGCDSGNVVRASGKWADLLPSIPAGSNYLFHTPSGGGEPLFGSRTRFWSFLLKLDPARPAWTLSATPGPATGPFHWKNRPLSPEELARLQTFPREWRFHGARGQVVKQIGNATPPLLAEVVARRVAQALGARVPKELANSIARVSRLAAAPIPGRVPSKYLSLRAGHSAHPGHGLGPKPRRHKVW